MYLSCVTVNEGGKKGKKEGIPSGVKELVVWLDYYSIGMIGH